MCLLAGPNVSVAFTHISSTAAAALPLASADEVPRIARAEYHEQDVLALMQGLAHSSSDGDAGAFAWFLQPMVRADVGIPPRLILQLMLAGSEIVGNPWGT
ncbi:hypothetical protein EDB85DRAFT_2158445 [Lactarius pseudohatsudake]|nr:hypothetical protein EDB85DRAFT_2158445 [Lactarius pseudohatsudake]